MRRIAKVDDNQQEIVLELRKHGICVQHLHQLGKGTPDLLLGYRGKNFLVELKDGRKAPSKRRLTPDELHWHESWRGQVAVAESVEDILKLCEGC